MQLPYWKRLKNSNGTTLAQKKLQGAVLGGMVLSVNEVPDGSADSMITDISGELQKLRDIAQKLQLPNAMKINWTLIQLSTSDSAATQKRFNKLIEEKREDEERFGSLSNSTDFPDVIELVENLCCMHLGINLRKAFLEGIKEVSSSVEDNPVSDVLVHEFCKLLSQHGTKHGAPEYAHGSVAFPDFLELMSCSSSDDAAHLYYTNCLKIKLDRQVGSRYFVTAFNAGKIVFLRKAAIQFLGKTKETD